MDSSCFSSSTSIIQKLTTYFCSWSRNRTWDPKQMKEAVVQQLQVANCSKTRLFIKKCLDEIKDSWPTVLTGFQRAWWVNEPEPEHLKLDQTRKATRSPVLLTSACPVQVLRSGHGPLTCRTGRCFCLSFKRSEWRKIKHLPPKLRFFCFAFTIKVPCFIPDVSLSLDVS